MSRPTSFRDVKVFVRQSSSISDGELLFPKTEQAAEIELKIEPQEVENDLCVGEVLKVKNNSNPKCEHLPLDEVLQPHKTSKLSPNNSHETEAGEEDIRCVSDKKETHLALRDDGTSSDKTRGGDKSTSSVKESLETYKGNSDAVGVISSNEHSTEEEEEEEEEEFCCICLEEYTEDNPALYGECKHHFHLPCLMNWKQRSNVCPMCAAETLQGLADDNEPPPQQPGITNDDIMEILIQHELERYARRHGRRHHQLQRVRGRGRLNENSTINNEQSLGVHNSGTESVLNRDGVRNQRQRGIYGRQSNRNKNNNNANVTVPTTSSQNPNTAHSGKRQTRQLHETNHDPKENSVLKFFSRWLCCKK